MEQEKIENLLRGLAEKTHEDVRPGLATQIKGAIPNNLAEHKGGFHNVRIIIDLRVTKLTAAAAIIITLILCLAFLGGRQPKGEGFLQNTRDLVLYLFQEHKDSRTAGLVRAFGPDEKPREVFYYGNFPPAVEPNALLMHWELDDGKYRVVFRDFKTEVVSASELVKLQAKMLNKLSEK